MGLDVYLYKYENREESERKEKEYETASESLWNEIGGYNAATETQKETVRNKEKEVADKLGLDKYGTDETLKKCIEIDSKTAPEHYFKIGYFRSSYNESGINRVLENLGIPGLYEIFEPNDEYIFQPDWNKALKRVDKSIAKLEKAGAFRCFDVSENMFGASAEAPKNEKEALDIFLKQQKEKHAFGAYSNGTGTFYMEEPLEVVALIPGTTSVLGKQKCVYVVMKSSNEWILNALKIVKETVEYVLAQEDKQKYYLHWSG